MLSAFQAYEFSQKNKVLVAQQQSSKLLVQVEEAIRRAIDYGYDYVIIDAAAYHTESVLLVCEELKKLGYKTSATSTLYISWSK